MPGAGTRCTASRFSGEDITKLPVSDLDQNPSLENGVKSA
jgi:hypothetical protein